MKKKLVLSYFLVLIFFSFSQKQINFNEFIDKERLFHSLSVLANDSLEGRNTGELGQHKAANFIVKQLKEYACNPYKKNNFLLPVNLLYKTKSANLNIDGQILNFINHFSFSGEYQYHKESIKNLKVISQVELSKLKGNGNYAVLIPTYQSIDHTSISEDFKGFLFFFIKSYDVSKFNRKPIKSLIVSDIVQKPINFYIDFNVLNKQLKKDLKRKKELVINIEIELNPQQEKCKSDNIHAYIEGSDSILKNEALIVSAHYDHIGTKDGKVFNGADDNASGSATILEMARVFQQLKNEGYGLKRSLLFLWFTGEEHGLLGSAYYAKNPIIPFENTITNLNIDMIGRADTLIEKEQFKVYVIGSDKLSQDLHDLNEKAKQNLSFDYKYNDEKDPLRLYYRSDHYNFASRGIPSIFYFGGFHEDYHKASDDLEKINFDKMKEIAISVSNTCLLLLNAPEKPRINK